MKRLGFVFLIGLLLSFAQSAIAQNAAPTGVRITTLDAHQRVEIVWTQTSPATIAILTKTEPGRAAQFIYQQRSEAGRTHTALDAYGPVDTVYTLFEYADGPYGYTDLGSHVLGQATAYTTTHRLYLPLVVR